MAARGLRCQGGVTLALLEFLGAVKNIGHGVVVCWQIAMRSTSAAQASRAARVVWSPEASSRFNVGRSGGRTQRFTG